MPETDSETSIARRPAEARHPARHHAAFGLPIELLDVIVVEDSKPMQAIMRSVLTGMRVRRLRIYDSPEQALRAMMAEPPNLVITDWKMKPVSGYKLLKMIRHKRMGPLAYVPVLFLTAFGTRELVEKVLSAGAHHLLVKPLAPSALHDRLMWLSRDNRKFILDEETGYHVIEGVAAALEADNQKRSNMHKARLLHQKRGQVSEQEEMLRQQVRQQKAINAARAAKAAAESGGTAGEGAGKGSSGYASVRPTAPARPATPKRPTRRRA